VKKINLEITSEWAESCVVGGPGAGLLALERVDDLVSRVTPGPAAALSDKAPLELRITVPERVNLLIIGQAVNVTFHKKVM
jgi:hypothetical protein